MQGALYRGPVAKRDLLEQRQHEKLFTYLEIEFRKNQILTNKPKLTTHISVNEHSEFSGNFHHATVGFGTVGPVKRKC
jgi:hypothetical protein